MQRFAVEEVAGIAVPFVVQGVPDNILEILNRSTLRGNPRFTLCITKRCLEDEVLAAGTTAALRSARLSSFNTQLACLRAVITIFIVIVGIEWHREQSDIESPTRQEESEFLRACATGAQQTQAAIKDRTSCGRVCVIEGLPRGVMECLWFGIHKPFPPQFPRETTKVKNHNGPKRQRSSKRVRQE